MGEVMPDLHWRMNAGNGTLGQEDEEIQEVRCQSDGDRRREENDDEDDEERQSDGDLRREEKEEVMPDLRWKVPPNAASASLPPRECSPRPQLSLRPNSGWAVPSPVRPVYQLGQWKSAPT